MPGPTVPQTQKTHRALCPRFMRAGLGFDSVLHSRARLEDQSESNQIFLPDSPTSCTTANPWDDHRWLKDSTREFLSAAASFAPETLPHPAPLTLRYKTRYNRRAQ